MRKAQYTLSARTVQEHAACLLQKHLQLEDFSRK